MAYSPLRGGGGYSQYRPVRIKTPPSLKPGVAKIYENFQKNKTMGAKRPKIWAFSGREAPGKKIGFLSVLKGKTVKRCGREAPENLGDIKTMTVAKNSLRFQKNKNM